MSVETRRYRLDAALAKLDDGQFKRTKGLARFDGKAVAPVKMTDRQVAFQLLAAFRIDGDDSPHLQGIRLDECSDVYVTEYALAMAGDCRPESEEEAAQLERIRRRRVKQ